MSRAAFVVSLLIAGAGTTALFISHRSAIRRATEAIERADEYWASDELLFEPRFREAEQAVAEVGTRLIDPVPRSTLNLCLAIEQASRSTLRHRQTSEAIAVTTVARVYGEATALMLRAAQLDGTPGRFEAEESMEKDYAPYTNAKTRADIKAAKAEARLAGDQLEKKRKEMQGCIASLK